MNSHIINHCEFSHILNIFIDDELCENERNTIILTIYNMLNKKKIIKNISDNDFAIIWSVSTEKDLLHYYTNSRDFIIDDDVVYYHTKMVVNDIRQHISKDKVSFMVTKPIMNKN